MVKRSIQKATNFSLLSLALSVVALFAVAMLLIVKSEIHSDVLYFDEFIYDMLAGGALRDWKLAPAPAFVPDMLLYFLAYQFLPTAALRIFFVSFIQVFLLCGAVIWCAKKILGSLSLPAVSILVGFTAFASLVVIADPVQNNMMLYMNSNSVHFSYLFFSLFCLPLFFDCIASRNYQYKLILFILIIAAVLSDPVFILTFVVPALMMTLFFVIFLYREKRLSDGVKNRLISCILVLLTGASTAKILQAFLISHDALGNRTPFSYTAMIRSFRLFIEGFAQFLHNQNPIGLSFHFLIILVSLSLIAIALRFGIRKFFNKKYFQASILGSDNALFNAICFIIFLVPVNMLAPIVSGAYVDEFGFRYFVFTVAMALILFVVLGDRKKYFQTRYSNLLIVAFLSLLLAGAGWTLDGIVKDRSPSDLRALIVDGKSSLQEEAVAGCLKDLQAQGYKFRSGIADYWRGRAVSYYLDRYSVPVDAVLNNLTPYFWISTVGPWRGQAYFAPRHYNFVLMLNDKESKLRDQFDFSVETVGRILPSGYTVHMCLGTDFQIWHYAGDQLNDHMQAIIGKTFF